MNKQLRQEDTLLRAIVYGNPVVPVLSLQEWENLVVNGLKKELTNFWLFADDNDSLATGNVFCKADHLPRARKALILHLNCMN